MMEKTELFLATYIERARPAYRTLDPQAAHWIALAFLSFKHGLFDEAVQRSDQALEALGGGEVGRPQARDAAHRLALPARGDGAHRWTNAAKRPSRKNGMVPGGPSLAGRAGHTTTGTRPLSGSASSGVHWPRARSVSR